jgi:PAS domain S-box-containing protein
LGIWEWDLTTGLTVMSDECYHLWGLEPRAGPIEQDWFALIHPDDRDDTRKIFQATVEHGAPMQAEYRIVRPDGETRWLMTRGGRVASDASGRTTRLSGITLDVTERKRLEQELERAKAVAEQANRAKDHFLAVLSHELRTPLTPVVMGVSMLQDRLDLDPAMRETLEMVRRNAEMEARLIDDLLDVTRIARGKIELNRSAVQLDTVIQRAVEVCKSDIEARRLHFDVDFGPAAPYWVEADVPRLQQVFWNLLKNAIKFTPHGGCVGIRCWPDENHVLVEVNDSGMGIEPEALSRVFNAFEQVEQSITQKFGGLGLGLAISKALVEMHGGTIEAYSEGKDKGATFSIRLPLTAPVSQPDVCIPAAPPRRAVRPLRILLVEDHGVTAKMMKMVLTAEGHTVETAGDIATALELADKRAFELLISDLGLPDGSGHDLMRQLHDRGHKFPGIAMSGYGQEEDIQRSYQAGFATHLTKPSSREAVIGAIVSVTAGEPTPVTNEPASTCDSTTIAQPDTPAFDGLAALERCLNKQDLLAQVIQFFFDDVDKLLPQIHAALQRGELTEVGRLGHQLKGTTVHLAAERAREAALRVENVGQCGCEQAEAEEAVRRLDQECQLLKAALAEYRPATAPTQHIEPWATCDHQVAL